MPDPTALGTGRPIIYSLSSRRIKITYHPPTGGGCFIDVTRDFRTPEEERLIRIAEVTYPLRDAIWPPDSVMLRPLPSRKHLWTLAPEGEVGVPYALTRDALLHFLDVSQLYGRGKPPDGKPEPMKVCDLTYSARVSHQPPFRRERTRRDTSTVELRLEWSGGGASYRMGRTVLFDHRGDLVAVRGDHQSLPFLYLRR